MTGALPAAAPDPAPRPNLLVIYTDDQRWDALGLAGHPFLRTPHLDRIGREGTVFAQSFVTSPLCSPSRASLLTGQYAHTHGVRTNEGAEAISFKLETFPLLLQRAGYRTGYLGKFHMGDSAAPRPGFDRWVVVPGQGRYVDPVFNIDGREETKPGYIADLLTDYAVDFIERQPADRPFCLIVAHKGPHSPFVPAPRHAGLFAGEKIERRPNSRDNLAGKPMLRRELPGWPPVAAGSGPGDELIRNQLRTLLSIDEGVGRLLEILRRKGELERTAIVFTSDNGYFWGEHGLGDKRAAYEEALRVPLHVRYPALVAAGHRSDALVLNIDVAPTLLELAGVAVPAAMQGQSLLPLLRGAPAAERDFRKEFLGEYTVQFPDQPRIATWVGVRDARWKFLRYPTLPGMEELYDLHADPFELHNLAGDPANVDPRFELEARLDRLLAETKHPGRFTAVTGVLIDNWQSMTTRTQAEARRRTRTSMLTDGNFNSGYAIMGEDGRLTPILKADRERVAAYLAAESRETDLRVRAEFFDEGLGAWLAGLWPILGRPDTVFTAEGDTLVMEAEHAQRSEGFRTGPRADASGSFAVQVVESTGSGAAALEFRFEVKRPGKWRLWIRSQALHHRQNGLVLQLDGKPLAAPPGHPLEGTTDVYLEKSPVASRWQWKPEWQPNHRQEQRGLVHTGPVTIELGAGVHTLAIGKRKLERPLIDKVVLTLNAATVPRDLGPPESRAQPVEGGR